MSEAADFRLIRAVPVTDARLTSSTIPETTVTAWSGVTTYALNDIRGVNGTGNSQVVYKSLQNSNLNHTPASSPTWWRELGTVYGTWSGATTYALADIVTDATNHLLYESLQASNLNHPLTDIAWWSELGPTNRWKMFDEVVNTQSTQAEEMTFVITPSTFVDHILLLNVDGTTATLTQATTGFTQELDLVQHDVSGWYEWFTTTPTTVGDAAFTDIPPLGTYALTLTVVNPGGTAKIGRLHMGKARFVGTTLWEFRAGVTSYSVASTDDFGNTTITRRANAKRLNFDVYIRPGYESAVYNMLSDLTDEPICVIGTTDYNMSFAYGFLGQWEVPVSIQGRPATIEFKGLT